MSTLLETIKPIALALCLLSLSAVFYTAFLAPASSLEQRLWDGTTLLTLAAGISVASGMIFRETTPDGMEHLAHTLPMRVFCFGACIIVILFIGSWYLETYCIFYRDVRRF